jgi:hypothetical protein
MEQILDSVLYAPKVAEIADAYELDCLNTFCFDLTVTDDVTLTFANLFDGQSIIVVVRNADGKTITWDEDTLIWQEDSEPSPTTLDVYRFIKVTDSIFGSAMSYAAAP